MKNLKSIFAFIILSVLQVSCSQDSQSIDESLDLTTQIAVSAKNQVPASAFDNSMKGIYHGIIASGTSQSRGKIWINLANDARYSATVEMVGGNTYNFELVQNGNLDESEITTYQFQGLNSGFKLDISSQNSPVIRDAYLDNDEYLSTVVKSNSRIPPFALTGVFNESGGGAFSGTWSLISSGNPDPIGWGYETIGTAMVTFNSHMFTDTSFETFNYPCVTNPSVVPMIGSQPGNVNAIISHAQTSNFAATTSWDLSTGNGLYFNNACGTVSSGTFTWNGSVTKSGTILMD